MSSFFEKLKKGMGIEIEEELEKKVKTEEVSKETKPKKNQKEEKLPEKEKKEPKIKTISIETEKEKIELPEKKEVKKEIPQKPQEKIEEKKEWPEPEGELAVDVYQTEEDLVIQTVIAGVKPEDLDVSIERDILTIRGIRRRPFEEKGDYFVRECFWGSFAKEIILPVEVDPNQVEATMKEGILTIRIPKILREKKRIIKVKI